MLASHIGNKYVRILHTSSKTFSKPPKQNNKQPLNYVNISEIADRINEGNIDETDNLSNIIQIKILELCSISYKNVLKANAKIKPIKYQMFKVRNGYKIKINNLLDRTGQYYGNNREEIRSQISFIGPVIGIN